MKCAIGVYMVTCTVNFRQRIECRETTDGDECKVISAYFVNVYFGDHLFGHGMDLENTTLASSGW